MTDAEILRSDPDPRHLVQIAQRLAMSTEPDDQLELRNALLRSDLLTRLDEAERLRGDKRRLRLRRVLDKLRRNPAAAPTLAALCADAGFLSMPPRVDLLIEACSDLRPPPAESLRLWDLCSQPEDGYSFLTIQALCDNGTPQAVALLCAKLLDPAHPDDDKVVWMRTSVLTHRTDADLLGGMLGLLRSEQWPEVLKLTLVEALVDWQPEQWYPVHGCMYPPDWQTANARAVAALDAIAQHALQQPALEAHLRHKVKAMQAAVPR